MKYLFGPVNSRRLGRSLGIDLVPFKTCTLNCVYCECGATTALTLDVNEYVPTAEVIAEVDEYLSKGPRLDAVTFSGSGEPTLHNGIGDVIRHIRERFPGYRIAVLTNGTLLWKKEVRERIIGADLVIPSLDAATAETFRKITRPSPELDLVTVIHGLRDFREIFSGMLILEIFIIPGINDTDEELSALRDGALLIRPDRVELNRLDRPGAEKGLVRARDDELARIAEYFRPLEAVPVGEPDTALPPGDLRLDARNAVMATLERRPSTMEDLEKTLGLRRAEIVKILGDLEREGCVKKEEQERGLFYRPVR